MLFPLKTWRMFWDHTITERNDVAYFNQTQDIIEEAKTGPSFPSHFSLTPVPAPLQNFTALSR